MIAHRIKNLRVGDPRLALHIAACRHTMPGLGLGALYIVKNHTIFITEVLEEKCSDFFKSPMGSPQEAIDCRPASGDIAIKYALGAGGFCPSMRGILLR